MAERKAQTETPYGLDPKFERVVAGCCATNPSFMTRVGFAVNANLMAHPPARLVVAAAQEIYKEMGRGPSSTTQVIQRIRRSVDAGKVKVAEVAAAADMLSEFITGTAEGGTPAAEVVVRELAPVLKKVVRLEIANQAIQLASQEDISPLRNQLQLLDRIGVADIRGQSINSGEKGSAALAQLKGMMRWPSGIKAIDDFMKGGPPRGTLTTFMAGTGGGKSMALSHIFAFCMREGLFPAYATMEIPSAHVLARAMACRSGVTIDEVLQGDVHADALLRATSAPFAVMDFPAKKTTMADVIEWVRSEEEIAERAIDILLVDYADLLAASTVGSGSDRRRADMNTYQAQGDVYTDLRDFIRERDICGYTASQSRGREERDGKKRLDIQHAADSSNKPRLVDQWITVNVNEETQEIDFFFAKNRYGEGRKSANGSPYNFALGRVGPWVDETVPQRQRQPGEDDADPGPQVALDLSAVVSGVEVPF
jgi:hypothetical protein